MIIKASNAKSLIEQIRIWRKSKKLTQKQFADLIWLGFQTIGGWERNKVTPNVEQIFDTIKLMERLEQEDCDIALERKHKENVQKSI